MHKSLILMMPLVVPEAASLPRFNLVDVKKYKASVVPFNLSWINGIFGNSKGKAEEEDEDKALLDHESELPLHLMYPDFVEIHEYNDDDTVTLLSSKETLQLLLQQIGKAARKIVDASQSDVVLFRNLSSHIHDASDFATFFQGCLEGPDGWTSMEYVPFGTARRTLDTVDLVTPFPPHIALPAHNEMCYNPQPANLIAFYCLEDAQEGGETILTRNSDLTSIVSKKIQQFVTDHGGVVYAREYPDGSHEPQKVVKAGARQLPTWQVKTGSTNRTDARKYFTDIGFAEDDVYFDDDGTLHVKNIHSGFTKVAESDKGDDNDDDDTKKYKYYWFNILNSESFQLADGTRMPPSMIRQLKREEWSAARVLKLEPGDWIVIRNRFVQHGRLPFVDSAHKKRTILTVYTAE